MNPKMLNKKMGLLLLLAVFIFIFINISVKILGMKPKVTAQLLNKCTNEEKLIAKVNQPSITDNNGSGISIIHSDYNFLFPYSEWKRVENLTNQFEEPIRFPKVLYSLHLSFPIQNNNSLFLNEDNIALVSFTVSPDYCVSVEEWFSNIPNFEQYNKSYHTYNSAKWLIAKSRDKLPVYQIAMINAHGYHYEFNFTMRDKKSADSYKQLMDQLLSSFYIIKK